MKSFCYGSFHDRSCDVASAQIRLAGPVLVAAFVLLATGCATRSSVNRLRADVTALQAEMTELRQAQHALATSLAREAAETRTFVPSVRWSASSPR